MMLLLTPCITSSYYALYENDDHQVQEADYNRYCPPLLVTGQQHKNKQRQKEEIN